MTTAKAVVLGDSMIGGAADGSGGLGKALAQRLPERGWDVAEVVGVGGSTVAHWIQAAGGTPQIRSGPGRWSPRAVRPLTDAQRQRADLERLFLTDDLGLVWVNLGTNDAATLAAMERADARSFDAWVQDAIRLTSYIPAGVAVVWSVGNGRTGRDWDPVKEALVAALKRGLEDHGVTVLGPGEHYAGEGVHPSVRAHLAWLEEVWEAVPTPQEVERSGWPVASWLFVVLAVLLAWRWSGWPRRIVALWGLGHLARGMMAL